MFLRSSSGLHTIERLISWNKTVVGGCYWDRRGGGKLIAGGGNIMSPIPHNSLAPVGFNGTGCLAVHRQVYLDIAAKFPDTMSPDSLGNECGFFTNIQRPDRMLGEDESFAWRATEAGHPTYLDLGLMLGHISSGNVHALPAGGSKIYDHMKEIIHVIMKMKDQETYFDGDPYPHYEIGWKQG